MSKDIKLDISAEAPKDGVPATIDERISFYRTERRFLRTVQGVVGTGFLFFGIQAAVEAASDTPSRGRIIGNIVGTAINAVMLGYFHGTSNVDEQVEANLIAHKIIQESAQLLPSLDAPQAIEQSLSLQLLPPPVSQ